MENSDFATAADRLLAFTEADARDPSEVYRDLLTQAPVAQASDGNWIISRYADMRDILSDNGTAWFREKVVPNSIGRDEQSGQRDTLFSRTMALTLLNLDPPRHTRLKRIFSNAFLPGQIVQRRALVERIMNELVDEVLPRGRMDLVRDVALPLPIRVISEMLGFAVEEEGFLARYTHVIVAMSNAGPKSPELCDEADRLTARAYELIGKVVEDRRKNPKDDLISEFVALMDGSDKLTYDELVGNCIKFHVAGHETTGSTICNGVATLMDHPAQWDALCADPSLVDGAVEEILRYCGAARLVQPRVAEEDYTVGGITIPAGDQVICWPGISNRDPEVFPDPDRFDITRTPNRHFAFGYGRHTCIGHALARLEIKTALIVLSQRIPGMKLDTDRVEWRRMVNRGIVALPVRW